MSLKSYQDCCRFCLNKLKPNMDLELHEYFEDLYYDITGKKLVDSQNLPQNFCFTCNDVIAKMLVIVNNQDKLFDLLYGKQPASSNVQIKQELETKFDEPPETLETVIVKEEPVFASDEVVEVESEIDDPPENEEVVIAIESSDDDERIPVPEPKKRIARLPPKPKQKQPQPELFCPYEECQKLYTTKKTLKIHIEGVHMKLKKFRCKISNCGYTSYQRTNMITHQINVHKLPNPKTYFCEQCGTQFPSSKRLKVHRDTKHLNIKNFECDYCGRRFYGKSTLRQHIPIHKTNREVTKCDFPGCHKTFVNPSSLKTHVKFTHQKILLFECHCGKKFAHKNYLIKHQKYVHDKIKDAHCEICDKRFGTLEFLKHHKIAIHSAEGEKPSYPCEVCGQTFVYINSLNTHMKIHKDPEFTCEFCSKKYFFKQKLLDHMEKHVTLQFPCSHCKRSFRNESQLRSHSKRVHFKEKRTYRCEICSSTFTRRTTYRDHVLKQHTGLETTYRKDLLEKISKMLPEEKTEMESVEKL